ncbi:DUF305 domain-containing protein [Nocardioides pacificus]
MINLSRAVPLATVAALALLAGCGSGDESSSEPEKSATEFNEADVAFATDMIQHHAQALSMVDLTLGRPLSPETEQLVEDIRNAQAPEIETMSDWLVSWDEPVPETMRDHANAHGDGEGDGDGDGHDTDMPGMMSGEQMTALEKASDAEFEDLWLEMMVEHHEGAVEMAEEQQEDGQYDEAVELAEDIVTGQQAEIEMMEEMLAS